MSTAPLPPPVVVDPSVSIARLHGEACWFCGAVAKVLRAAGTVVIRGTSHVWPIATCGCRSEITAVTRSSRRPHERPPGLAD